MKIFTRKTNSICMMVLRYGLQPSSKREIGSLILVSLLLTRNLRLKAIKESCKLLVMRFKMVKQQAIMKDNLSKGVIYKNEDILRASLTSQDSDPVSQRFGIYKAESWLRIVDRGSDSWLTGSPARTQDSLHLSLGSLD